MTRLLAGRLCGLDGQLVPDLLPIAGMDDDLLLQRLATFALWMLAVLWLLLPFLLVAH